MRTTWENPDPAEHYTRPCARCGRDTCIDLLYACGAETDVCWRCAGRYPAGCGCEAKALEDAGLTLETHDAQIDTMTFHCATCGCERLLDDLPRATLTVCTGLTMSPFTQLMCWPCVKILVKTLHDRFCPQDCGEEHEVR